MKRIDTATAEVDKFGPGRNGFTYGDPGVPTAPTEVDDTILDSFQEELANTVELNGDTLDESNLFQVPAVVLGMLRDLLDFDKGSVASGLTWTADSGLDASLSGGVFYANGRRYTVTAPSALDTPRTFANNSTRYVFIGPDPADERGYIITDTNSPLLQVNRALTAIIVTSGGVITSITNMSALAAGPMLALSHVRAHGIRPSGNNVDIGLQNQQVDGLAGRFREIWARQDSVGNTSSAGLVDDSLRQVVTATRSGAGNTDVILVVPAGYAQDDTVTVQITTSGKRTDSSGFAYSAKKAVGGFVNGSSQWQFSGSQTTMHEGGGGGGARSVDLVIDGSGRIVVRHALTGAETWRFVTEAKIIRNQG